MELVTAAADDPRLLAFHRGIYLDAFADKHEPIDAWRAALRGEAPYALTVQLAVGDRGDAIVAGICAELYRQSGCGLLTYLVVAPTHRRCGLGERLVREAIARLRGEGAAIVLGEVVDPARDGGDEARDRLARFVRWGARILDARYIQPALGPGLARDPSLLLIAFPPLPEILDGAPVRRFVAELYAATEGGPPDPACRIPEQIVLLARPGATSIATPGPSL